MTEDFLQRFVLIEMYQMHFPFQVKSIYSICSTLIQKGRRNPALYDGCRSFFPLREISHHTGIFSGRFPFPTGGIFPPCRIFYGHIPTLRGQTLLPLFSKETAPVFPGL
jgi:hypothetical protein